MLQVSLLAIFAIVHQHSELFTKLKTRCTELFILVCLLTAFPLRSTAQRRSPHKTAKGTTDDCTTSAERFLNRHLSISIGACRRIHHTNKPRRLCNAFAAPLRSTSQLFSLHKTATSATHNSTTNADHFSASYCTTDVQMLLRSFCSPHCHPCCHRRQLLSQRWLSEQ